MHDEATYGYTGIEATARPRSTTRLFAQVMFLVAVALGLLAFGAYLGQDLSRGAALACSLGGFGMLLAQSFGGERFRVGPFAIGWLYALSVLLGLGLGPALSSYVAFDPAAVALVVGGVGSMSPVLSLVVFAASALLIMVDFNYLRKHGTEADTVWLATGILVSIVNIFVSLLNLFGGE